MDSAASSRELDDISSNDVSGGIAENSEQLRGAATDGGATLPPIYGVTGDATDGIAENSGQQLRYDIDENAALMGISGNLLAGLGNFN